MKTLLAFLFTASSLFATVTTEQYYRLGEDGWRMSLSDDYYNVRDSSGHRRGNSGAKDLSSGAQYITIDTNNPAPGSSFAYVFDGRTMYNYANHYWIAPTNNIGVEGWVRVADLSQTSKYIFGTVASLAGLGFGYDPAIGLVAWVGDAGSTGVGLSITSTSLWTHVATVHDGSFIKFYTNGVLCQSVSDSSYPVLSATNRTGMYDNTRRMSTARWPGPFAFDNVNGFKGSLDELRVFTFNAGEFDTTNLLINSTTVGPQSLGIIYCNEAAAEETNITAAVGESIILRYSTAGKTPLTYYWMSNTVCMSTSTNFLLTNITTAMAGPYYVIASNSISKVTGPTNWLQVYTPSWPSVNNSNAAQTNFTGRQYGMFVHYNLQTFMNGNESDVLHAPASLYNITTDPNTDQWVNTAWKAGMNYVVLTVKQAHGFCLWPSKHTTYSVANPLCANHADVVRLLSDSCRTGNLGLGIYYGLSDFTDSRYNSGSFYPNYFNYVTNQLTELLTQYGPVCELWFDCFAWWHNSPLDDHWGEIYTLIHTLQPNCAVVSNSGYAVPGLWDGLSGKEITWTDGYGMTPWPSDVVAADAANQDQMLATVPHFWTWGTMGTNRYYAPFDSIETIQKGGGDDWFWNQTNRPLMSVNTISNRVRQAVAGGNNYSLNVPPDTTGVIPSSYVEQVLAVARALGIARTNGGGGFNYNGTNVGSAVTPSYYYLNDENGHRLTDESNNELVIYQ